MTTIYLHIGLEKTATTTIQKFLIDNRIKLYNLGIFYPLTGIYRMKQTIVSSAGRYGHLNLHWELEKLPPYDPYAGDWSELLREVDALLPNKTVISAETLYHLDQNKISQLKNLLQEYDVKILFCVRKQEDFIKSLYSQYVKTGVVIKTITQFLKEESFCSKLNYYETLKLWTLNFGAENTKVLVFEEARKEGVIQNFLKAIDFDLSLLDDEMLEVSPVDNKSPNIKVLKVTRIIYKLLVERLSFPRMMIKKIVLRYLVKDTFFSRNISKLPDFVVTDKLLDDSLRNEIANKYKESNRILAREFMGKEQLFNEEE